MRFALSLVLLLHPLTALAQSGATGPLDPLNFPRLKNFSAYRVSSNNLYVDSNDDSKHPVPGETIVLANLSGPGIVTHIWITVADNEYAWPRRLRLRVYYDGHKTPSVDAPLGDFFGVGHGFERSLNSLMVRDSSFGRAHNCYWPMPFRKSCKITVTNEGERPVTSFYYHVDWQKHASLPADIAYFHAYYRQASPAPPGENYTMLNIRGTGHYVGTVLNVIQTQVGWFGEGDDAFYVDGEKTPRIDGTGTEDYFNDAWGLRVSDGAWTGTPIAEGEGVGARLTGYRWHVPDVIPFASSLRVEIEHKGWTYNPDGTPRSAFEERPDNFSSVAFWYQKGVNEDLSEPAYGPARLPQGNAQQIEVENLIQEVTAEKGEVSVQKEVFWSKDLLFLKAQGPGARVNIPLEVQHDGRYEVMAQIAQAPDYGDYVATLDGKLTNGTTLTWGPLDVPPPEAEVIHNYLPEVYVAPDRLLGWFELTKGRHLVSFTCVGKDPLSAGYNLGIDGVVLAEVKRPTTPVGQPVAPAFRRANLNSGLTVRPCSPSLSEVEGKPGATWAAGAVLYRGKPLSFYQARLEQSPAEERAGLIRAIGSFGEDAVPATAALQAALSDANPETRAAAALAISHMGPKASGATRALAQALKDEQPDVRVAAALALREIGKGAHAAVPDLCSALNDPVPAVRMTAAAALGNMGEAAQVAVPSLIARLEAPDETVQVMRNVSTALGNIGPAARSALPALIETRKKLRVQWAAREAILKIEGKSVPTWH